MATINVKLIGDDDLKRKLVSSRADKPVGRFLGRAAFTVQGAARKKAPVDTGRLRNSIGTESPTNRMRRVGPNVDYGAHVEYGTRPHWPPPGVMAKWAKKHGMTEKAARFAISRSGTRKQPYMQPAVDESEAKIAALVSVLSAEIESAYQ